MTARKQPGSKKTGQTKSKAAQAAEQQAGELNAASVEHLNVEEIIETAQVEETETEKDVEAAIKAVEDIQKPDETEPDETEPEKQPAAQPEKQPDDGFLYLNKKPKYWRNKVYVPDVGIVSGQVEKKHFKRFFALAPKTVKLERWLADSDTVQERIDTARKKMKSRANPNKE